MHMRKDYLVQKNGNDQEYRVFYWGMPDRGVRPVIEIPTDELG